MYYHEVRKEVVRVGPPTIVRVGEVIPPSEYNFRSTFDYPVEVADKIKQAGNTAGLKGLPVSCTTIYIDVDEQENVDEVRDILQGTGVAFDEYKTGNRGCHFHVTLAERITGTNVCHTVTSWLRDIGIWELIDSSVYKEGSQFRMESAVHGKTGESKVLTDEYDGDLLRLSLRVAPPITVFSDHEVTGDKRNFFLNLLQSRGVGGRHSHLFILWKSGMAAGFSTDTVHEAMRVWNDNQNEPHTEAVMDQKMKGFR